MPMTPIDKKLYNAEVARIRREGNMPDGVPIVILDCDVESTDWIPASGLTTPASRLARAKFSAANNREEGGE